ncbi:MAG: replication initiation protein [Desulfovibrionaceae bacterium]|nr:replication initiation protein [Desulfovibrionaceae bacterium]
MNDLNRTMKAAHEAAQDRPGVVIKAEEASDIYYARGTSPSLLARRSWNLLIQAAAGEGWKDHTHSIKKRDLCFGWHVGPKEIEAVLEELQTTLIKRQVTSPSGRAAILTTALLSSTIEETDNDDTSRVWFRFTPELAEMLRTSRYYVELEKLVFLNFECKYSHPLYERGVRKLRDKRIDETIKLEDLRGIFGIPKGKLKTWQDLRRFVIERATAEVNQLAPFLVKWSPVTDKTTKRHNPPVLAVRFFYEPKNDEARQAARKELAAPKVGRVARRKGTIEQIAAEDKALGDKIRAELEALPPLDDGIPE